MAPGSPKQVRTSSDDFSVPDVDGKLFEKLEETKGRLAQSLLEWQDKVQSISTSEESDEEIDGYTALELKQLRQDFNKHVGDTQHRVVDAVKDWGGGSSPVSGKSGNCH